MWVVINFHCRFLHRLWLIQLTKWTKQQLFVCIWQYKQNPDKWPHATNNPLKNSKPMFTGDEKFCSGSAGREKQLSSKNVMLKNRW